MADIKIRQARLEDIDGILIVEEEVWPKRLRATKEQFISRIETFPEGILVAINNGDIVGVVATQIMNYNLKKPVSTWNEVTDYGFIKRTHNPEGNTLYGVDLSVSRFGADSSRLLMEATGRLIIKYNLKQGVLGARIPRYHKFADKMAVEEYINSRKGNRPIDPEIAFYRRLGLKVAGVLPNYIEDPESCNYGILLVWKNPFYGKPFPKLWSRIFKIK